MSRPRISQLGKFPLWEILPQDLVKMESDHGQRWKQTSDNSATRFENSGTDRVGANQERQEVAGNSRPLDAGPDRHKKCRGRLALFLEQSDVLRLSRLVTIINQNREFAVRDKRNFNRRVEIQTSIGFFDILQHGFDVEVFRFAAKDFTGQSRPRLGREVYESLSY